MNSPLFRRSSLVPTRQVGFTLIELLVVISIIAILAGLLLPVVSKVMENAKKAETKSTATQVVTAIKAYQTEYGQYPVQVVAGATPSDTNYDTQSGNAALFQVLVASNNDYATTGLNTRRIKFFEGRDAKSLSNPRSGFVPSNATSPKGNTTPGANSTVAPGDLVDSWGNRYLIRMDSNYTDVVMNPYTSAKTTDDTTAPETDNTKILRFGVVVWTYGSDGQIGTKGTSIQSGQALIGDDVVSWQ